MVGGDQDKEMPQNSDSGSKRRTKNAPKRLNLSQRGPKIELMFQRKLPKMNKLTPLPSRPGQHHLVLWQAVTQFRRFSTFDAAKKKPFPPGKTLKKKSIATSPSNHTLKFWIQKNIKLNNLSLWSEWHPPNGLGNWSGKCTLAGLGAMLKLLFASGHRLPSSNDYLGTPPHQCHPLNAVWICERPDGITLLVFRGVIKVPDSKTANKDISNCRVQDKTSTKNDEIVFLVWIFKKITLCPGFATNKINRWA